MTELYLLKGLGFDIFMGPEVEMTDSILILQCLACLGSVLSEHGKSEKNAHDADAAAT